jgi:CRP-like cAMP-binding protein
MVVAVKATTVHCASNQLFEEDMTASSLAVLRPFASSSFSLVDPALSERAEFVFASSLFAGVKLTDCAKIASFARLRSFGPDQLLFIQGHAIQNVLLIQSGNVKLTQTGPGGNEVILWMGGFQEAIGLQINKDGSSHTCTARAMQPCRVLSWNHLWLQGLMADHPEIRNNITRILSGRLEELQERFREVATERVSTRLVLTLLRLMRQIGRPHKFGTQVSLSREELAQMVGTTLFTTSRILSKWNDAGLILALREAVVVTDARKLELEAERC